MNQLVKRSPIDVARAAWGDELPAWVEALALEAGRTSGVAAGKRIGYTGSLVSSVLANKYKGRLDLVEERVAGALMGAVVDCPILGEIARDRCLDEQKVGFSTSSSVRTRLYRACRGGCEHSRIGSKP
ncbi:transcriptional regulator [Rhodopseudomonas palustris]|uniref:Transcriptional regulator n=1 Tax=Rhodopseudomonas palustris TaxID=1076 RepID=A0A323UXH4_RHOPL|nr:transcriptional regulator [Rhodopseudomonas palustris]PZA12438.1 transcriptional regulator [Rhodopseudomonas palustris]